MENFNLRFEVSKLEGFGVTKLTGNSGVPTECIVIPKNSNNIFYSEKTGRYYMDLVCIETPNSEYGSHMVTISKTKEEMEQEKATGERIRKPIVGNLKPFGGAATQEFEEYTQAPAKPTRKKATAAAAQEKDDAELPF